MKVMLTTLCGDTPWIAKILQVAGATATNGCHECYVPTISVQDDENVPRKQKYSGYAHGFRLTQPMVDLINATKTEVK